MSYENQTGIDYGHQTPPHVELNPAVPEDEVLSPAALKLLATCIAERQFVISGSVEPAEAQEGDTPSIPDNIYLGEE